LGVADRIEVLPTRPNLVGFTAIDPTNRDLTTGEGDTLKIVFDRETDRAARPLGGNGKLNIESEAHELFDFYDRYRRRIVDPLFLEYSSGWVDASTFTVTVINGTLPAFGMVHPDYRKGDTVAVDQKTQVALRAGVEVVGLGCPAQYVHLCSVPTGRSPASPKLSGDFGRITAPAIVSYTIYDPDNGDAIFGDGDILHITFDQRTNRAEEHADYLKEGVFIAHSAEEPTTYSYHSYPFGGTQFDQTTVAGRVGYVDHLFAFSQAMGNDYSGAWLDAFTFRIAILDGTSAEMSTQDLAYHRPSLYLSNVTARPSSGLTSNYTAKTCNTTAIVEDGLLGMLLNDPQAINSTTYLCTLHYANSTSPGLRGDLGTPTTPC
jgi:hypothetical protein